MNRFQVWKDCTNILCIRPDNLGDVLMTTPAFRALKEQNSDRKLTLLTSRAGSSIARYIPEIDHILTFDLPWIKTKQQFSPNTLFPLLTKLKKSQFDGAVIFTNYSQNSLPTVMLSYMAQIPNRLAYCRENPYGLLTDWIADTEPFSGITHGVQRQLDLVAAIGATTNNIKLSLTIPDEARKRLKAKLTGKNIDERKPIIILHPGVSEKKRQYSIEQFAKAAKELSQIYHVVITGVAAELPLAEYILQQTNTAVTSLIDELSLDELIALIETAAVIISNNTGPVHIAAAVQTPVIVIYARTNMEHTPWQVPHKVLYFDIPPALHSKNQILQFSAPKESITPPTAEDIVQAVDELLEEQKNIPSQKGAIYP